MGATTDLAALGLAGGAGESRAGKHAVLGGDPAAAGVAQPSGDSGLDGGVAEDAGVAGFDEDGAFGSGDVSGGEFEWAEMICGARVGTKELGGEQRHYEGIIVFGGGAEGLWGEACGSCGIDGPGFRLSRVFRFGNQC